MDTKKVPLRLGLALSPYLEEFKRFLRWLISPLCLAILFVFPMVGGAVALYALIPFNKKFLGIAARMDGVHLLHTLAVKSTLIAFGGLYLIAFVVIVYFTLSYGVFVLSKMAGEIVSWLYFSDTWADFRNRQRFNRALRKRLARRNMIAIVAQVSLISIYVLFSTRYSLTFHDIAHVFLVSMVFCTVCTYVYHWIEFLIYRREIRSPAFDRFLFSKSSVQRRLKMSFDMLFFLALIGWVVIPGFGLFYDYVQPHVCEPFEYLLSIDATMQSLGEVQDPLLEMGKSYYSFVKSLFSNMSVAEIFHVDTFNAFIQEIQSTFFALVIFIQFVMVAMPLAMIVVLKKNDRGFYFYVFKSTMKTVVLLLAVQFFIAEVYFVDTSSLLGTATIFLFFLSYFSAHDLPESTVDSFRTE